MSDEVEMIPVTGAEPPVANPLAKPAAAKPETIKLNPIARPTIRGLKPGLKLPPKPGATVGLKPGLKLPPKPGATVGLKPGLKLPPKPIIRKPGAVVAAPLPKPVEELKAVTQKLKEGTQQIKGVTQPIPQQAILRKTGIIAGGGDMSAEQFEAVKHKTVRIALSDAIGVAPVKDENAPMKTIRIKRPINIPESPAAATPPPVAGAEAASTAPAPAAEGSAAVNNSGITQRRTLKIARPGAKLARPTGKFAVKRPTVAATAKPKAENNEGEVADIPDIPAAIPPVAAPVQAGAKWPWVLSSLVQFAACVVIGVLAWLLSENVQLQNFCGGLGWELW